MGFMDFWNDLWDGGGIGKKGTPKDRKLAVPATMNPMASQNLVTKPKPMKLPSGRREVNGGPVRTSQIKKRDVGKGINFNAGNRLTPRQADFVTPPTNNPAINRPDPEQMLIDDLISRLNAPDNSMQNMFSDSLHDLTVGRDNAKKALLEALNGNLGALNGLRGTANSNFKTSDANLAAMHNAYRNDIATKGRAAFQDIRNDHVSAIDQSVEGGTNRLAKLRSQQNAERAAMLQRMGLQAAAKDESGDVLNEGISYINKTGAAAQTMANELGQANQARNQGMATAVGAEGLERRSALKMQLQQILGQIGNQEAAVRGNYNNSVADLEMQYGQQRTALNGQQSEMAFQQHQAELENARAQLDDIYARQAAAARSEAEMAEAERKHQQAIEMLMLRSEQSALRSDRELQLKAKLGL